MSRGNGGGGGVGCAALVGVLLVIGLIMWVVGGTLTLLGVLLPIAGVIIGLVMFGYSWLGVYLGRRNRKEDAALFAELSGMASDSGARLDQVLLWWDRVQLTRGIGTDYLSRMDQVASADAADPDALRLRELLGEAREVRGLLLDIEQQPDPQRQLKLVNRADRVWADLVRHYIREPDK